MIPWFAKMGRKGCELTPGVKNTIIDMINSGFSRRKISDVLKIPKSTVIDVVRKFLTTGSVENKPRSGRPKKIKDREFRKIERIVNCNRRSSLQDITNKYNEGAPVPVAKRTVQDHLYKHGFNRRVCKKKVFIREVNRKKRLAWCREKRRWTVHRNWNKIIFSDESKIMIGHDLRVYVWRKKHEGWRPDLIQKQRPQPKFEVMIWGCICWHGVGTLAAVTGNINAVKYQEILEDNLWPVIAQHFPNGGYHFQDDNAPVHRARSTQEYIAQNGINGMSWPAQSPDMNIIENVWLYVKRKLQTRVGTIKSKDDLFAEIQRIWMDITPAYIQSLYKSLPKRILNVIRLKGYMTKY